MSENESENDQQQTEEDDEMEDDQEQPSKSNFVTAPSKKRKQGIIYISSLPKNLNVAMIRELFEKYGEVKRIFLQPKEKLGKL
jgi:ESF2/ABP1 family protein